MELCKKKRFLYIVEANLDSGSGKCAFELIQLFKNSTDFEPVVVTQYFNDLNIKCDELLVENYNTHYARTCSLGMGMLGWAIAFFCRPFLNFFSYRKLKKKIDFSAIRLIHSNSSSIDFGAYLHKKLHIPHIWHVREFLVFDRFWTPIIRNLPNYISQNSSQVVTVSNQLKDFLQRKTHDQNITTFYDGVCHSNENKETRKKNTSNKLRLVCVGNLAPIKGQDFLLDAISLLPPQVLNDISIDFYGTDIGGFEQKLKSIVHDKSIEHVVSFKGFCNNVFNILPNYDVGIQPSHTEGFSRVPIEYMLAGLCVIGNKDTSIQELIEDGKNGLLYKDYDLQSLADKISFCFFNRMEMNSIGLLAQKNALDNYCIEKNFYKIVDMYNQVMELKC